MRANLFVILLDASVFSGVALAQVGSVPMSIGSSADWITTADYPAALKDAAPRDTAVRLMITSAGTVSKCDIVVSSKVAEIDALTCRLLTQRARYQGGGIVPLLAIEWAYIKALVPWGQETTPTPSRMGPPVPMNRLSSWITPEDRPFEGKNDSVIVRYRVEVDTQGNVANCSAKTIGETVKNFDRPICSAVKRNAKFWPARDRQGNPVYGIFESQRFFVGDLVKPRPDGTLPLEKERSQRRPNDLEFQLSAANMPAGWRYIVLQTDLLVGPDGAAKDCSVTSLGPETIYVPGTQGPASLVALVNATCSQVMATGLASLIKDPNGRGVASTQRFEIGIRLATPKPAS